MVGVERVSTMPIDATAKTVIETIGDAGCPVMTRADSNGSSVVEATDEGRR